MDAGVVASRIRALRERRGYSMRELAKHAGVSVSFLSSIETAKSSPTLAMLLKILEALDTTAPEFFDSESRRNLDAIVFSADEMIVLEDGEKASTFLFPESRESRCIMTYEEYQPHTRSRERESHPRDVCVYILEGGLTLEVPGRELLVARSGDSVYLRSGTTHIASNRSDQILRMVVAEIKG